MVTFVLSSSPEQIPVQIRRYAIISRPDIASVKDLKGKRPAINTLGSSADFAIYQLLSRNGLTPTKMSRCYRSPAAGTPVSLR
jgi:ABC-type nitrate/sulfonate/bicarbonate transport system substrate-binding protein